MDELEQRLRSALTEMAEGVPPSHHAWTEQERRLALKSRRARLRPALMAAVAAAVVALIAVPVMILNARPDHVDEAGSPTTTEPATTTTASSGRTPPLIQEPDPYQPKTGETLLTKPLPANSVQVNRDYRTVYVYAVRRDPDSVAQLCTSAALPYDVKINSTEEDQYGQPVCLQLSPPKNSKTTLWLRKIVAGSSPGAYVYVMTPNVERVMVRRAEGDLAVSYGKASGPDFNVMLVNLNSNQAPTAFTSKDAQNNTLENGN